MAKFCKECGVKYNNSAKKCVICGAEFNDEHIYKKKNKYIILSVIAVIVVLATVFAIVYFTGPRWAVRDIMDAHKNNDADTVVSYFPDFLLESDKLDSKMFVTEFTITVRKMSEYLFSYDIEKVQTPSSSDKDNTMEGIMYYAGEDFDEAEIEDVKIVWVNYTGNVPGIWPRHALRFVMIKYDGRWCWWPNVVGR